MCSTRHQQFHLCTFCLPKNGTLWVWSAPWQLSLQNSRRCGRPLWRSVGALIHLWSCILKDGCIRASNSIQGYSNTLTSFAQWSVDYSYNSCPFQARSHYGHYSRPRTVAHGARTDWLVFGRRRFYRSSAWRQQLWHDGWVNQNEVDKLRRTGFDV